MAVFGVSFSGLAFEVVLARVFAISQWNHLSFMVISIALFGFAASGSFLSMPKMLESLTGGDTACERIVTAGCVLLSASLATAWFGLNRMPLDYYRLLFEPIQIVYLLALYFFLILPFFFSGWVIAVAYVAYPLKPGSVYFASMTGSALGAFTPSFLLPVTGETGMLALTAIAPLIVPLTRLPGLILRGAAERPPISRRAALPILVIGFLAFGVGIWMLTPAGMARLAIRPSEYKYLSQVLQFPATRVQETYSGIRGRIDRVTSPHLRFAPGLSLKYTRPLPPVEAVVTDGDQAFFLYDLTAAHAADFARFTLSFCGYELFGRAGKVLVICDGGGLAIPCAIASDAPAIRIVQQNPHVAYLIERHYGIEVTQDAPRSYLARTRDTFDVIHLESWGASLPGADALRQDHLLTVESLAGCLERLTPEGVLIISRKLLLPPANTVRLWATVRDALHEIGTHMPELNIAVLRNWDTFTLMATRQPIPDPASIWKAAHRLNFDVVYLQGFDESSANRFNVFDAPYHFSEIQRLKTSIDVGRTDAFFADYILDVAPQTDLRAFPGRFLKWTRIADLYRTLGSRIQAMFLAGEVIVVAVFVQALLMATLLLLLPATGAVRKMRGAIRPGIIYFSGIGAGFMLAEMLFIYAGTVFLGDPVISLSVVVTVMLLSSGLGGIWAQSFRAGAIRPSLLAAAGSVVLTAAALNTFSHELLALPQGIRYLALAFAAMIPGFTMGIPFPLGMRYILKKPVERSFAWAVNGCASVLASVAAAQMAISWGFALILAAVVTSYGLAALAGAGCLNSEPHG